MNLETLPLTLSPEGLLSDKEIKSVLDLLRKIQEEILTHHPPFGDSYKGERRKAFL